MAEKNGMEGAKKGQNPGSVFHQRRKLRFTTMQMAFAGFLITAAVGYFALNAKAKPEATAAYVAKTTAGGTSNDDPVTADLNS